MVSSSTPLTWQHLLREDNSGPSAASIPPQFVRVPDGEQPNPRRNNQGGRPGDSDAKTTSGNSGGGLYNAAGELIGINTTIAGGAIGFSIRPIDLKPEGLDHPRTGRRPRPEIDGRWAMDHPIRSPVGHRASILRKAQAARASKGVSPAAARTAPRSTRSSPLA